MKSLVLFTKNELLKQKKLLRLALNAHNLLQKLSKSLQIRLEFAKKELKALNVAYLDFVKNSEQKASLAANEGHEKIDKNFSAGSALLDDAWTAAAQRDDAKAALDTKQDEIDRLGARVNRALRRAAAFEHVVIPNTRAKISQISDRLEEMERDAFAAFL
jgi:vacuolar-type H+-ATPase subunit D/Vma8